MNKHTPGPWKIEKGTPAPPFHPHSVYPWGDMGDGDCLFIPTDLAERPRVINTARVSAHSWLKRHRPEWRVAAKMCDDGVRVWLIAPSEENA